MNTLYFTSEEPRNLWAYLQANEAIFVSPQLMEELEDRYIRQDITDNSIFGLDIETYPVINEGVSAEFDSKRSAIRTIQIYNHKSDTSVVFDLMKMTDLQKKLLCSFIERHRFFIHNALFDVRFLQEFGVRYVQCIDTMIMYSAFLRSRYANSKQYSVSLKEAVHQLFNKDISKLEQVSDWSAPELTQEQINYAGLDAYLAWKVGNELKDKPSSKTDNFKLTNKAINAVARIIRNGIYLDTDKLDVMIESWRAAASTAEIACNKYYGDMNIRSGVQLGAWLKKHLTTEELALWPKTDKGSLKTDTATLMEAEHIEALKPLVTYKKYQKYISTYGESIKAMINPVTHRLHPSYTLAFTDTGRMSSRDPNVQNFPRPDENLGNYRELFVPQWKGKTTFVCADYSQVEVRVAAILSNDKRMLEAYKTGKDLYKLTASLILHKKEEDVTKEERQRAKAVVLGLQFGMGYKKLCQYAKQYGVEMSENESAKLVENYRLAYPNLYEWQQRTTREAAISLKATTVGGMVRKLNEDNYYTCSLNTPVQGSAAEALLYTLWLLDKEFMFEKIPAKIVATVHDEILVECKVEVAEKVKDILEQSMMLGFTHVFPNNYGAVNNIVEAHIGDSWYDAK